MKSLEMSVIRAEGLEEEFIECAIFFNSEKYSLMNFKSHVPQSQIYLPLNGELGLKIYSQTKHVGEIFINVLKLERDGLQWLPIMSPNNGLVNQLPEEVPLPRILVSLCENKNKFPDFPIEQPCKDIEIHKIISEESFYDINYQSPHLETEILENECAYIITDIKENNFIDYSFDKPEKVLANCSIVQETCLNIWPFIQKNKQSLRMSRTNTYNFPSKTSRIEENQFNPIVNDLKDQLRLTKSRLDLEIAENREKTLIIDKMKGFLKEKDNSYEDNSMNLNNIINKLKNKLYQKKKILREKESENKISKEKLKSFELQKHFTLTNTEEKNVFLQNSLKESEDARENLIILLENVNDPTKTTKECNDCIDCIDYHEALLKTSNKIADLTQHIEILNEKHNTQDFHNQELIIQNQEFKNQLHECKEKYNQLLLEKNTMENEIFSYPLSKDDLDERVEIQFPEIIAKSIKIIRGIYLFKGKKIKITENGRLLNIFIDNKEITYNELLEFDIPKHEKNSFSLEDISNQIDTLKPTNLIHNRGNLRENKLRILTKQW